MIPEAQILGEMERARRRALDALARYKFWMFGYHAAAWIKYNHLLPAAQRQPNPFAGLVKVARGMVGP